jgi:hypothetical protein
MPTTRKTCQFTELFQFAVARLVLKVQLLLANLPVVINRTETLRAKTALFANLTATIKNFVEMLPKERNVLHQNAIPA